MWNKRAASALLFAWLFLPAPAFAADEEGCLICHRLELRKASADGASELRVSDLREGPHEALYCSDCHADAKTAPHVSSPGPAGCIGECHSTSRAAAESHRLASFGGLTESHRKASAPRAPCLLCHKSDDPPESLDRIIARCGACHARERDSAARGVHARIGARGGGGMCAGCHVAHQASVQAGQSGASKAGCGGKECHAIVSDGMRRLGGHAPGFSGGGATGRAAEAGVFLAIVALGALSGRGLRRGGKGGAGER